MSRAGYVVAAVGGLVSTVIGTLVAMPVFAMGLVVPITVVWPLTLAVCALAASVVAGLFVELSRSDGPGVRLPVVILATEAAAGVLVVVSAIALLLPYWAQPSWPAIYDIVAFASALALVATVAAWRFRVVGGAEVAERRGGAGRASARAAAGLRRLAGVVCGLRLLRPVIGIGIGKGTRSSSVVEAGEAFLGLDRVPDPAGVRGGHTG